MNRFRHRDGVLPGAVVSAVAYEATGLPAGEHRGMPSPWITFIVSTLGPVRTMGTVHEPGPFEAARAAAHDVMVAGLHPVAARVEQPSAQSGVQLAVHPLSAPAVLGCRASDLVATADDGRDVLGRVADELHDRLSSETDAERRLDVAQQWLRSRAGRARTGGVRPEVARAWQVIQRSGGACRVEDVARDVALSPRQLRSLMRAETGLSPKQLCRTFRFDAAIAHLVRGTDSLAEIAVAAGYADQSHLTREFRQMAGCSPTQWFAEARRNIQDGGYTNRPDSSS